MKNLLLILAIVCSCTAFAQEPLDCENMCVTSIVMNAEGGLLDITIVNGDVQINYPIVTVVVEGDTVANINQEFYFFAQLPGQTVTHTIPTFLPAVPANFVCTVIVEDNIYFTQCELEYPCLTSNIMNIEQDELLVFPNPTDDIVNIHAMPGATYIRILDMAGRIVSEQSLVKGTNVDISALPSGAYQVYVLFEEKKTMTTKFIKR